MYPPDVSLQLPPLRHGDVTHPRGVPHAAALFLMAIIPEAIAYTQDIITLGLLLVNTDTNVVIYCEVCLDASVEKVAQRIVALNRHVRTDFVQTSQSVDVS